ncbi:MAG: protein-arginine omega-N symmetric methyltransferase 9, partial [Marteilia pararefringens]
MIDCIAAASSPAAPPEAAPLWHIAMLNDSSRNSLYRRSIAHAFEKLGCRSIMDIGCGSGLLAAYALQTGYSKVYGCEVDKNLYEIAKNLVPQFKKNEDSELILVNEYSED